MGAKIGAESGASGGLRPRRLGERAVLAVGLASALALAWAGLRLTDDPDQSGQAALARLAGEVADGVVAEWQRLLRSPEPPVNAATGADTEGLRTWGTGRDAGRLAAPPRRPPGEHAAFDALLAEASLAEVQRDDPPGALALVEEALTRTGLDDVRRLAGHLRAIQLAGRLERPDEVARHWGEAARLGKGDEALDDVSLLLACALAAGPHLPPEERATAAHRLSNLWLAGELTLPTPDRGGAGQAARRIAWRERLVAMLADAPRSDVPLADAHRSDAPSTGAPLAGAPLAGAPLAGTLVRADRADLSRLALEERFGVLPRAPDDGRWHLLVEGDAVLLHRARTDGGSEGVATTVDAVRATLGRAVRDHGLLPAGFVLEQGAPRDPADDEAAASRGVVVREAVSLGAAPWTFTLRHTDPDAVLASEQARQRAVRLGMFVMAAACLGAAVLTARALRRERALAGLKSAFVASVSHELRTPVASILLMAENLEQGRVTDDEGRRRYHGHIRAEAQRLRRLVDDVLDFSRLERGRLPHLVLEPVDPASLADDLEGEARRRVTDAGLDLQVRRGALPESVMLDAEAVRRAVLNLVDNAVRHSGSPAIELVLEPADGELRIVVADRGRGVPADRRRSIFAPFERLDEQRPGAGLGLPIVQAIARGHGGEVQVRDRPDGPGAWFELRLPLAQQAASRAAGDAGEVGA